VIAGQRSASSKNAIRRFVILPDVEMALSYLRAPEEAPAPAETFRRRRCRSGKRERRRPTEAERRVSAPRPHGDALETAREAASLLQIPTMALLNKLKKWELDGGGDVLPARREKATSGPCPCLPPTLEPMVAGQRAANRFILQGRPRFCREV